MNSLVARRTSNNVIIMLVFLVAASLHGHLIHGTVAQQRSCGPVSAGHLSHIVESCINAWYEHDNSRIMDTVCCRGIAADVNFACLCSPSSDLPIPDGLIYFAEYCKVNVPQTGQCQSDPVAESTEAWPLAEVAEPEAGPNER